LARELTQQSVDEAGAILRHFDSEPDQDEDQTIALFDWQGYLYAGRLRYLFHEKPYVVVVSKLTEPVSSQAAAAMRRDRRVPTFKVHPRLEFAGPRYLLGVSGSTLCSLSGEDVLYCLIHSRNHPVRNFSTGTDLIGFDAA
jgi:hypothetical protein